MDELITHRNIMKKITDPIAFGFSNLMKSGRNMTSCFIRLFNPVKKKRILMWSYYFKQYSCNPRAVTEYLLENYPEYEIYWAFRKKINISGIDKRVKCVRFNTVEFQKIANTAEFLVTNCRTAPYGMFWKKRPEQKYLMLWHGGVALKKIEKDVAGKLSYKYNNMMHKDSAVCDLMISGCRRQTDLIRSSFYYDGEILECGTPRTDIFFDLKRHEEIRQTVRKAFGIPEDHKIVLYAPTFRKPATIEPYRIDWKQVVPALKSSLGTENVTVLLRLHPNLIGKFDTSSLMTSPEVKDATRYHDMHELLCVSDMLITDYSSSMFDMMILDKPCLIYATDIDKYDRGYYFNLRELPFPLATSQKELIGILKGFDLDRYMADCKEFDKTQVGFVEKGTASKALAEWIVKHSL